MSDITSQNSPRVWDIPAFLQEKLFMEYGERASQIKAGFLASRCVSMRANPFKTQADKIAIRLKSQGIFFERVSWYPDAFLLEEGMEEVLHHFPEYENGEIYLQSLSSMLPPLLMRPQPGESILDMTAAPGGKTAELAALSGGKALITACEKDAIRFERLKFNLQRQGALRVNAMKADALKLDDSFRFDKVLLDAPCSGSGTLQYGKPIRISEKLLDSCVKIQYALLKKAIKLLKKGGLLLYSTCSILKEENEAQIKKIEGDCELMPIDAEFIEFLPLLDRERGMVTICPNRQFEGFFLALLKKK